MAEIYVARSSSACKWGASVGLTKHIYKVGVADDSAQAAVKALNQSMYGAETDWKLLKKEDAADINEAAAVERLSKKEKMVDPALYPKIKGARGIFKVKPVNAENYLVTKMALENNVVTDFKLTPIDIATYLINNALR